MMKIGTPTGMLLTFSLDCGKVGGTGGDKSESPKVELNVFNFCRILISLESISKYLEFSQICGARPTSKLLIQCLWMDIMMAAYI